MNEVWWVVIILGVITIVVKAAGPVALGSWKPSEKAKQVLMLVSPVVLSALIAVQIFTSGHEFQLDERAAGLGAALVALLLKAPLLVVVLVAVAATAATRALV
ncbi:hypothetical protein BBK82_40040 [Lentzea guizhouensis]|uniref:Branched-chain amino acid transporter AzlD n=1 Tax=Lentzea guizhouensis TaxID=1586287 RepID=A0A1B2HU60_9PSEU|nr:AzlD domain-containing protein [Lentzea guizhouensis]ANZ41247.1 hypothetical protein BBK82_40040 [Lentzea guizhouensis]